MIVPLATAVLCNFIVGRAHGVSESSNGGADDVDFVHSSETKSSND